jgi:hypothetical protein
MKSIQVALALWAGAEIKQSKTHIGWANFTVAIKIGWATWA